MKRKIIGDSSIDTHVLSDLAANTEYSTVPLKIRFGDEEFTDDVNLDREAMLKAMREYNGPSASACPSPGDWIDAFEGADEVFAVTITSGLSGSYNSAMTAKEMLLESNPDKKICIIDSLSAGPELLLIAQKLNEYIKADLDFETICEKISEYQKSTHLLFKLVSLDNLVKNGRIGKVAATMANLLNIHVVGMASEVGTLEVLHKCRGVNRAYGSIIKEMTANGYSGGKVIISHCCNPEGAEELKARFIEELNPVSVEIVETAGLCSYYAEIEGILIGYEA